MDEGAHRLRRTRPPLATFVSQGACLHGTLLCPCPVVYSLSRLAWTLGLGSLRTGPGLEQAPDQSAVAEDVFDVDDY